MNDGTYQFYTLEHRRTHETLWLEPNGKLNLCENTEWVRSNPDYFREVALSKKKQARKRQIDHNYMVLAETGCHWGWYDLRMAKQMLDNVQRADYEGKYGTKTRSIRYEFRLVFIRVSTVTLAVPKN